MPALADVSMTILCHKKKVLKKEIKVLIKMQWGLHGCCIVYLGFKKKKYTKVNSVLSFTDIMVRRHRSSGIWKTGISAMQILTVFIDLEIWKFCGKSFKSQFLYMKIIILIKNKYLFGQQLITCV